MVLKTLSSLLENAAILMSSPNSAKMLRMNMNIWNGLDFRARRTSLATPLRQYLINLVRSGTEDPFAVSFAIVPIWPRVLMRLARLSALILLELLPRLWWILLKAPEVVLTSPLDLPSFLPIAQSSADSDEATERAGSLAPRRSEPSLADKSAVDAADMVDPMLALLTNEHLRRGAPPP
mmetsp:Transcript_144953/g.278193  ORF Transcript_144953/g.278193 Transcript_144953/m.278193 type:complete len:179 (-) Transcript_144953:110-646(-)